MTPRQAIERFKWRFLESSKKDDKSFIINENDVKALISISDYYENESKRQIINNQLFGKLYIYLFGEFVKHYKCTVMDDIPQKEIHKLLDKDLRTIVQDLTDSLNMHQLEIEIKEGSIKNYSDMDYSEVAENMRILINSVLNTYE